MNMYEVKAKCGHVGRGYYVEKTFAVMAENGKEAAAIARQFPRVKHHHSDAIRYVSKISEERYSEIISENSADPYFLAQNVQEQRMNCSLDVYQEKRNAKDDYYDEIETPIKRVYYRKERIRNPKKYLRHYVAEEELSYYAN